MITHQEPTTETYHPLSVSAGFFAVLVVCVVLRLLQIDEWSIWIEENHLVRDVKLYMESLSAILGNPRPVFYLLVLPVFQVWGVSLVNARIISAFIGILTLPIFYLFARLAINRRTALIGALLLALSPWHIFWSQNARFYTILLLFYALAYVFFYLALETDRFVFTILAIGFLGAATLSHSIGALLVPLFVAHYIVLKFSSTAPPPGLHLLHLLPYVLLPFVGYFAYEGLRVFVLGQNLFIVDLYEQFFDSTTASFIGYKGPLVMFTSVFYNIGFPLGILSAYGAFDLIFVQRKRLGTMLAFSAYGPLVLLMLITLFAESTTNRYAFMSLPFWILLAASGIYRIINLRNTVIGVLLLILIALSFFFDPVILDVIHFAGQSAIFQVGLVLTILLLWVAYLFWGEAYHVAAAGITLLFVTILHPAVADTMYFAFQHGHRDNWQGAIQTIEQQAQPEDDVVTHLFPVGRYYLDRSVISMDDLRDNPGRFEGKTVWLIEDEGAAVYLGANFTNWVVDSGCVVAGDWDNFVAGRSWPMKLYRCTP